MNKKQPRKEPTLATQKVLYAQSAGMCSMPNCNVPLVFDKKLGKGHYANLAHIEAYSENGPRFNPKLSIDEINSEENIIVVCANCHKIIDSDVETYTVEKLKEIKKNHVSKISLLKENMILFDFNDLYYASKSILDYKNQNNSYSNPIFEHKINYDIKPIEFKMRKNEMSIISKNHIITAMLQQESVVEFISNMSKEDEEFPYHLKDTLKDYYNQFKEDYSGDLLLTKLYTQFCKPLSEKQQSACLAIIIYYFTICELFEK